MDEQLSAEAQAMVDEGMRLAKAYASAEIDCLSDVDSDEKMYAQLEAARKADSALRAHLERMAAMAAPQGEAQPDHGVELKRFLDAAKAAGITHLNAPEFAQALADSEIAQGEQP